MVAQILFYLRGTRLDHHLRETWFLLPSRDDERPAHLNPIAPTKWSSDMMDKVLAERDSLSGTACDAFEDFSIILQHEITSSKRLNFAPLALRRRYHTHNVEVDE
jgi:hypothetical protein